MTDNPLAKAIQNYHNKHGKPYDSDAMMQSLKNCFPDSRSEDDMFSTDITQPTCQGGMGDLAAGIKAKHAEDTAKFEGRAGNPKPYGNVAYADPANGKYPVDTEAHAKAAWSYINMPKNAAKYSPSQLAEIKGRIKAALKKFGVDVSDNNDGGND